MFQNKLPTHPRLFGGDTHLFNYLAVFGELIACHDTQLFHRTAANRKTQIFQLTANVGIADRLSNLGV